SEFTRVADPGSLERRARAYEVDFLRVDGNDVAEVASTMRAVVARLREGGRPVFVEALTFRVRGHYEGDQQKYRDAELDRRGRERPPVDRAAARRAARGVADGDLAAIREDAEREISAAVEGAGGQRQPEPATLLDYVAAPAGAPAIEPRPPAGAEPIRM